MKTIDESQIGIHAKESGAYSLTIKASTVFRPKETIKMALYLSGYGKISGAKLFCNPSDMIFDNEKSKAITDCKIEKDQRGFKFYWGANEHQVSSEGTILTLDTKIITSDSQDPRNKTILGKTQYSKSIFGDKEPDLTKAGTSIFPIYSEWSTEEKDTNEYYGPINFEYKILKNLRPGDYSIDFVFTYFNGEYWESKPTKFQFKVQNYLEKNATFIGKTAFFAAIIGTIAACLSIWSSIKEMFWQ